MLNARILLLEFRPLKEPELGEKGIGHKLSTIRFRNKALQYSDAKRDHRLHRGMLELRGPILKKSLLLHVDLGRVDHKILFRRALIDHYG